MIVVTEEDFKSWKQHQVTVAVMKAIFNDREQLKEMLLAGTDHDENLRGRAAAAGLILSLSYEDLMESLRENKE